MGNNFGKKNINSLKKQTKFNNYFKYLINNFLFIKK